MVRKSRTVLINTVRLLRFHEFLTLNLRSSCLHSDHKINIGIRGAIWSSPLEPKIQYALVGLVVMYHYFFLPLIDTIIHYFVALISKGLDLTRTSWYFFIDSFYPRLTLDVWLLVFLRILNCPFRPGLAVECDFSVFWNSNICHLSTLKTSQFFFVF